MPRPAKSITAEEFEDLQRSLHIEVTSITGQIVFGDILWHNERIGQVHLFRCSRLKKAIEKLRKKGIPVIFDNLVRNTRPPKSGKR